MIHRLFLSAIRSIRSSPGETLINVSGLGIAVAAFMLLMHYVSFEKSYEEGHTKAADIVRLTIDLYDGSEQIGTDCETYPALGPLLKKELPEVRNFVRVQDYSPVEVKYGEKVFGIEKLYAADPSLFDIFSYKLIKGNQATALSLPFQVVLSQSIATRLFGANDPLGKIISVNARPVVITGVMEDVFPNTHLRFDLLMSFNTVPSLGGDTSSWQGNNNYTYLLVKKGTTISSLNNKISGLVKERLKHEKIIAQYISDIHLKSNRSFEPDVNGDQKTVTFLSIVAYLIVAIGCINYVNLITANTLQRTKEAGMRKLLGSSKASLLLRYMIQTGFINLLSFVVAIVVIKISYPFYIGLTGKSFDQNIFSTPGFWQSLLFLFGVNTLISGVYPALLLSSVKPGAVIRRNFTQATSGNMLRKGLVVAQFSVAIIVLIASITIYRQVAFMRNQDLGMKVTQMLVLRGPMSNLPDSLRQQQAGSFINRLRNLNAVEKVFISGALPGQSMHELNTTTGIVRYGSNLESGLNYCNYSVDEHFVDGMSIDMVAGRNFKKGNPRSEVLINEEASRLLGFSSPAEAINQKITFTPVRRTDSSIIIGVLKDFKQRSAKDPMLPLIMSYSDANDSYYSLQIRPGDITNTISGIEELWKQSYPEHSFNYFFLDELIDKQYRSDVRLGQIIAIFSGLTLFITCLGILGLTASTIARRSREIGVRKVLGATVTSIVSLISWQFIKLVCIAIVVGSPIAWFLMNQWLADFHLRISVGWFIFAVTGLSCIGLAMLTIAFQAVRAAITNPIESLKSE